MTVVRAIRGSNPKGRTPFGYRVWATGKTFACHVWSPMEWARSHGFATEKAAAWWGMDTIVVFGETYAQYQADETRTGTTTAERSPDPGCARARVPNPSLKEGLE